MATATLPPSSTSCPTASSRASSPATRTAEGPMSTPRRDCPKSSGTPMMRICLGVSMFCSGLVAGLVAIEEYCFYRRLRIQPVQHARKRYGLAHVLEAAYPRHRALDAHAEAGVRHTAELPQVKVPLEGLFRQSMLVNALEQQLVGRHALRAANNFAVALGREHVHAQREVGPLGIGLHVERLYRRRITMHHNRPFEL